MKYLLIEDYEAYYYWNYYINGLLLKNQKITRSEDLKDSNIED
jgi:hypothetical protein